VREKERERGRERRREIGREGGESAYFVSSDVTYM